MSRPKVLDALRELDENGYYNKSTYLGDIRTTSTCLNSAVDNGIYTFTGGESSPTDKTGSYVWSLVVRSCHDGSVVYQKAIRLVIEDDYDLIFSRSFAFDSWSGFTEANSKKAYDAASAAANAASAANTAASAASSAADAASAAANAASNALSKANASLPLAGGTMTGAITLPGDPTENLHAATKKYVDGNKYTHPSTHPASMITGLADVISSLGYSQVVHGSYTGDGTGTPGYTGSGSGITYRTITLPISPKLLVIYVNLDPGDSVSGQTDISITYHSLLREGGNVYVYKYRSSSSSEKSYTMTGKLEGNQLSVAAILSSVDISYYGISLNIKSRVYNYIAFA